MIDVDIVSAIATLIMMTVFGGTAITIFIIDRKEK